jgi:hypothetical protein
MAGRRSKDDADADQSAGMVTPDQEAASQDEDAPEPRERADADDVEAEQGNVDEQIDEARPEPDEDAEREREQRERDEPALKAQREAAERQQKASDESRDAILADQGLEGDEGLKRLTRERGIDPDLPLVSVTESWETGYAGQVPDRTPNEAYQAGGDEDEAARADLRAATRGRLGND